MHTILLRTNLCCTIHDFLLCIRIDTIFWYIYIIVYHFVHKLNAPHILTSLHVFRCVHDIYSYMSHMLMQCNDSYTVFKEIYIYKLYIHTYWTVVICIAPLSYHAKHPLIHGCLKGSDGVKRIHIQACVCLCVYLWMNAYKFVNLHLYQYLCTYMHTYIYTYCTHIYIPLCIRVHIGPTCIHVQTYSFTNKHIT